MADAARAQSWSRVQAVAWIAFRTFDAVRTAAKIEMEGRDPLRRLVLCAAANEFRHQSADVPSRAVARAAEALAQARPDANGRYRSEQVKAAFPSKEGRGKGQGR